MAIENNLKSLVSDFRGVLDRHKELLDCFCKNGVQLEGWFKGEMLFFLENEKQQKKIVDFEREELCGIGRKKVDFKITLPTLSDPVAWVELKYWLIGWQKKTKWTANSYFGDRTSVGIKPDAEKLVSIRSGSEKFLLVLAAANPDPEDWSTGIDKFNTKFSPLHLTGITNPKDFPSTYFLGLLRVK